MKQCLEKQIVDQLGFTYPECIGCSFHQITLSASGNYLTNYTPCNRDVQIINVNNFEPIGIQDLKPFTDYYEFSIPLSDNGLCIANTVYKGFHVYDFNRKSSIAFFAGESGNAIGLKISFNGRYFLVTDNDYKLIEKNGSSFNTIARIPRFPELPYFEFDVLNPELVYYWDGSTFFIKNCTNFATINQYSLKDSAIISVDFFNNRMLTFNSDILYVRDLTTGEILHQISTYKNPNMWWENCRLINNTLISRFGIIYNFNEN